jgi:expansin (peptidoglycan-binding protein)
MSEPNRHLQYCTDAAPAQGCVAIAGGAQSLATRGRGLVVTVTGNIVFVMEDGSSMTWNSIPVGHYPFTVRSITSATVTGYVLL